MHWTTRHSAATALAVLFVATLLFLDAYGRHARVAGQPLSVASSLPSAVQLSRPSDAFRYWLDRNFHGRVIVTVTGRWQPVPIEREQLDRVSYPLRLKNLAREWMKALTDDNFLFVTSVVGIARKEITILPETGYLKRREISLDNKTFIERNGSFTLYHEGFAREFSTITSFRPPQEPALLYIEDSFAPGVPIVEIVRQLGTTGLMVDSVVLSHAPPATLPASAESR